MMRQFKTSRRNDIKYTLANFWSKVDKSGRCWEWLGTIEKPSGYGRFDSTKYKTVRPHRIAYELLVGEIPVGLQLDHLCRNRSCVNPEHLEPVTLKENVLRGQGVTAVNKRKTHCKRGHLLQGKNVYIYWKGRTCLVCKNLWRDAMRAKGIRNNI